MVPIHRKVADGVIENNAWRCLAFLRAREEKAEKNYEQDGNNVFRMIHHNVQIKCIEKKRRCNMHLLN